MLRSKFHLSTFLFIFLGCFIFQHSMAFCDNIQNPPKRQFSTDTLVVKIDSLRTELIELEQRLENQRQEYVNLLSSAVSISSSNVGNTITFLALIVAIITLIVVVFSVSGGFVVRELLRRQQKRYDEKYDQKAREFTISLEESRGNFYLGVYQYTQARDAFEKILLLNPENYFAHERLGFLYLGDALNQPRKAVAHNRKAIELDPNKLSPYLNLLVGTIHAKRPFQDTEAAYKKLINMCDLLGAHEMIYGKAKLFFAGELKKNSPARKDEAKQLYKQAMEHFKKVEEPEKTKDRNQWIFIARTGLKELEK